MSQYAAVSLRTASGFLESLRDGREIWLGRERVVDVRARRDLRGRSGLAGGNDPGELDGGCAEGKE